MQIGNPGQTIERYFHDVVPGHIDSSSRTCFLYFSMFTVTLFFLLFLECNDLLVLFIVLIVLLSIPIVTVYTVSGHTQYRVDYIYYTTCNLAHAHALLALRWTRLHGQNRPLNVNHV